MYCRKTRPRVTVARRVSAAYGQPSPRRQSQSTTEAAWQRWGEATPHPVPPTSRGEYSGIGDGRSRRTGRAARAFPVRARRVRAGSSRLTVTIGGLGRDTGLPASDKANRARRHQREGHRRQDRRCLSQPVASCLRTHSRAQQSLGDNNPSGHQASLSQWPVCCQSGPLQPLLAQADLPLAQPHSLTSMPWFECARLLAARNCRLPAADSCCRFRFLCRFPDPIPGSSKVASFCCKAAGSALVFCSKV